MAETNYEIIGRKLKVLDPDKFNELNDIPVLSDISIIPKILTEISCYTFESNFTKAQTTIAIMLRLYEPDVLNGWKKGIDRNGTREELSRHLSKAPGKISDYIAKVRNYYLIYKRFHNEVDYIASEIGRKYK